MVSHTFVVVTIRRLIPPRNAAENFTDKEDLDVGREEEDEDEASD